MLRIKTKKIYVIIPLNQMHIYTMHISTIVDKLCTHINSTAGMGIIRHTILNLISSWEKMCLITELFSPNLLIVTLPTDVSKSSFYFCSRQVMNLQHDVLFYHYAYFSSYITSKLWPAKIPLRA